MKPGKFKIKFCLSLLVRWIIKCNCFDDILNVWRNPWLKPSWLLYHSTINHKWIEQSLSPVWDIHTSPSFPPHPPLTNTLSYCLSSFQSNIHQSITALSLFSINSFAMHLLAFSLPLTKCQSIISSHSLSHSLPFSISLAPSFSLWLMYYPSLLLPTPPPSLHSLLLLINHSVYSSASLTPKRWKALLYMPASLHDILRTHIHTHTTIC